MARDLVRSKEDTRQDLMCARQRLLKLLLRDGRVYSERASWPGKHDLWSRQLRDGDLTLMTAFNASYEAAIQTVARRDRLDAAVG